MKFCFKACLCLLMVTALLISVSSVAVMATPVGGGQQSGSSTIKAYGCDMSFWNVGGYYPDYSMVDFKKMKADGCDFVILRIGFEGTASRQNMLDSAFVELYNMARAADMDIGVYFYALATTYEGAAEDARWCIDIFKQYGMSFEYPIYYDVEDPGNGADRPGHDVLTAQQMTELCLGWAQTLDAAGYFPGTYGGYEVLTKLQAAYIDYYDVWYAYVAYAEGIPEFIPEEQDHSNFCGMWQYSWKGSFDGASDTDIDVNVAYKNYPAIIAGGGYNNVTSVWEKTIDLKPVLSGLQYNPYNDAGEGVVVTEKNGSVTLMSSVSSVWAWPSVYMPCRREIDVKTYPYIRLRKSGTAHCNVALTCLDANGKTVTVNLAQLAGEENGEFLEGETDRLIDVSSFAVNGTLRVIGVTYFVMGAQNSAVTLEELTFEKSPVPEELTSSVYAVDHATISRVKPNTTCAELLANLDDAAYVAVYTADGAKVAANASLCSGMTVAIERDGTVVRSYNLSLIGDVNGDGAATTIDARLAVMATLMPDSYLSDWQQLSADYNGNGDRNTADVREMLFALLV